MEGNCVGDKVPTRAVAPWMDGKKGSGILESTNATNKFYTRCPLYKTNGRILSGVE